MVRTVCPLWICAAMLFLQGCKDKPKPDSIPTQKQEVAVDYAAHLPVAGNMAEQLQVEAAARPKEAIKVEAVLDALGKADVAVGSTKQFIGRPVLANYCFGGSTAKGNSVTVCEYASVDAAKAGLEHSQKQFGTIANRTLTQNKLTVMTLVGGSESAETKAEAAKAIEVFTRL